MVKIFRAKFVVPIVHDIIENAGFAIESGQFIMVSDWNDIQRRYPSAPSEDLGDVAVLPGLINAHVHLDYTMMLGKLPFAGSFTQWIKDLIHLRLLLKREDYEQAIQDGIHQLHLSGCTTAFNTELFSNLICSHFETKIRIIWFIELLDIQRKEVSYRIMSDLNQLISKFTHSIGLSPHAPYTVSEQLYLKSKILCKKYAIPLSTHLSESEDEIDLFQRHQGSLYEFLGPMGWHRNNPLNLSPIAFLLKNHLLPHHALLVHMNILTEQDKKYLSDAAGQYHIIHTPRTHHFFNRSPFEIEFFRRYHFPILLGTDSLASNFSLDLFEEMRAMQRAFPHLSPLEILEMVTINPAKSIQQCHNLGQIREGTTADFLSIPLPATEKKSTVYNSIIHYQGYMNHPSTLHIWINGVETI